MGAAQPGALVAHRRTRPRSRARIAVEPAPVLLGREPAQHRGEIGEPAQHGPRCVEPAAGRRRRRRPARGVTRAAGVCSASSRPARPARRASGHSRRHACRRLPGLRCAAGPSSSSRSPWRVAAAQQARSTAGQAASGRHRRRLSSLASPGIMPRPSALAGRRAPGRPAVAGRPAMAGGQRAGSRRSAGRPRPPRARHSGSAWWRSSGGRAGRGPPRAVRMLAQVDEADQMAELVRGQPQRRARARASG